MITQQICVCIKDVLVSNTRKRFKANLKLIVNKIGILSENMQSLHSLHRPC